MSNYIEEAYSRLGSQSILKGPPVVSAFEDALDKLVVVGRKGQPRKSEFFNPSYDWLVARMRIFQNLSQSEREQVLRESARLEQDAAEFGAQGKAAKRAGPDVAFRLNSGGLSFFSQLGVARRPDLTQYFISGFARNRDSLAFSEENQKIFADVFHHIVQRMEERFAAGDTIVQTDRRIGDVPGRSFHARQLLYGAHYTHIPYFWRQLTFDLPESELQDVPDIMEISFPHWLQDLGLSEELKARVKEAGLEQLVLKAPSKGLSIHLGFDYVGEHKMGPLSVAMFKVKQANGLAVQAALSMARVRTTNGVMSNTAMVTVGPSLHGKSTLAIMIDFAESELAKLLKLKRDPQEGVYPMNDDIVLLQLLDGADATAGIPYGIDGTENSFYAVPFRLNKEDDPVAFDVVRGSKEDPNPQETLENVIVDPDTGVPDYFVNPVRNMRMVLDRRRLLDRKGVQKLLGVITDGRMEEAVHVPLEDTDRVFWQAVMRQNTVIPPLRKLTLEQYVRVLMYGEAVQMGASTGAIGRPYVEYFSDPFIIGLEDEHANMLSRILRKMEDAGVPQEYYVFNTGGIGADTNDEAKGKLYKKIPREVTLMLQEALLRGAVKFEYDPILGSDIAVAILGPNGETALSLTEWLPEAVYGKTDYAGRVLDLKKRRYYGRDVGDQSGILRYTKADDEIIDLTDIPNPSDERELAALLSFCWHVDQVYSSLAELSAHIDEGRHTGEERLGTLQEIYHAAVAEGLKLDRGAEGTLSSLGILDSS